MSGGRVELGLGAGWHEAEHQTYAIDFPDTVGRFDLLEEQLELYGIDADEVKASPVVGTPAEVVEKLARYAATGADRAYMQILDLADLDHLDSEVLPHLS